MQLATFAQPDGELDPGPLEVNVEGDQCQAFLIHQAAQLVDLTAMGQQRIFLRLFINIEVRPVVSGLVLLDACNSGQNYVLKEPLVMYLDRFLLLCVGYPEINFRIFFHFSKLFLGSKRERVISLLLSNSWIRL